jgi:NADPH:quinone reductase-like Zn-dependent oxidoreductase
MHAAVVNVLGEAPKYQEFRDPESQPGKALIEVRAVGLHPIVKAMAVGKHYAAGGELPAIPGVDGVGVLPDRRRVYFAMVRKPWGPMAERAAAPLQGCIPLPDGLSDAEAAAIANPGMSARVSLKERAQLQTGETVLILGAAGVAGQLAVQTARQLGAQRVIGVGRNVDALRDAQVDAVIALGDGDDAVREAFTREAQSGIDVVIDYLWGRPTELLLEALAKGFKTQATHRTRLVEVGTSAGPTITLPGATLRSVDLLISGSGFGAARLDVIFAAIPELFRAAAAGELKVAVEPVPLSNVESAWNQGEKGRRVVFTV